MSFRGKDRANGDAPKVETLEGVEFVRRYLRHVLPRGMRSICYYGFFYSAAQASPTALHLPVLQWGNKTYCQLPPTLVRLSRPAAEEEKEEETPTPRQMTSQHQHRTFRRFRSPGPGADELSPRYENR